MTSFHRELSEDEECLDKTSTSASFIQACYDGNSDKVLANLKTGADPDTLVQDGLPVIEVVCYKWSKELLLQNDGSCERYREVFNLLLQYGAQVDCSVTTTSKVFGSPSPSCLILLVGMFRNVLEKLEVYGYPVYSEYGQVDFKFLKWIDVCYSSVTEIIAKGAYVNAVDGEGNTALHVLLEPNFTQWRNERLWNIVQSLIAAGADVCMQNAEGDTPFHMAMKKVKSSAELECRNYRFCNGQSIFGEKQNFSEISKHLSDTYIRCIGILTATSCHNVHIRNNKGKTVLHCAIMSRASANVVRKLLELGANPNCKDNHGILPFLNQTAINLIPAENPDVLEMLTLNIEAGFELTQIPRLFLFHIGSFAWVARNTAMLKVLYLNGYKYDILEYAKESPVEKDDQFYIDMLNLTKDVGSLFDIVVIYLRKTLKPNTVKGLNDLIIQGVLPVQIKYRLISTVCSYT